MYKDIIVCINESDDRENTIRTAVPFANEINANRLVCMSEFRQRVSWVRMVIFLKRSPNK